MTSKNRPYNEEDAKLWRKLWREFKSIKGVAEFTGVNARTISTLWQKYDV